jgi:hypothetical protein
MSPDHGWLQDMLTSARLAEQYVAGMREDEFLVDTKTQDSVVRRLEIIGEAANNVSTATRAALDVPWQQIIAQRHIVVHHYRKLVMPRIWATIHDDLPRLAAALESYLATIA